MRDHFAFDGGGGNFSGHPGNERNVNASFVKRSLGARKWHAVVAGEDHHGVVCVALRGEQLHELADLGIHAGDEVVIVGKVLADFGPVGKPLGDLHF